MAQKIKIKAGKIHIEAELNGSPTANAIFNALPIKTKANRWGGEIYFTIQVEAELETDAREVLEAGELGYWPTGSAFCIFFGKTPASKKNEIRAASAVNVIGKIKGDLSELWDVADGEEVIVEAAQG